MNEQFNQRDVADALGDYLALRSGISVPDVHPVAARMLRQRWTFADCVHVLGRSVNSADFSEAMAAASARIASIQPAESLALDRLTAKIPTKGIRPAALPVVDVGPITRTSGTGVPLALMSVSHATVEKPALYAARVLIARELVIDDEISPITAVITQLSAGLRRLKGRMIGEALDAAGLPETSETGLAVASVGEALASLRTRVLPEGEIADVAGKFLVVPASVEAKAHILNVSLDNRLEVVVLSWLAGTHAYLLADPESAAVLAEPAPINVNRGPDVSPTRAIEVDDDGNESIFDGLALRIEQYLGISTVGTVGGCAIPLA